MLRRLACFLTADIVREASLSLAKYLLFSLTAAFVSGLAFLGTPLF